MKLEKDKVDEIVEGVESLMDDNTMEAYESLYMLIVGKLSGTDGETLWARYQQIYDNTTQPETAVVSMVGAELGFPGMWDLLGGMVDYMAGNRKEPVPVPATQQGKENGQQD